MTERNSPKAELILTLEAMRTALQDTGHAEVRLAAIRGLLAHALAVALRVGSQAKPRRASKAVAS